MYLIKETAKLSGVSVRTLHHYDRIGLLVPHKGDNGYRYYDDRDIDRLQQICFYKYLGFSLKEIARLLLNPQKDNLSVLKQQRVLLEKEKRRLLRLIDTLDQSISALQGENVMTAKQKFAGFTYKDHLKYADEKYGEYQEVALKKQKGKEKEMMVSFNDIFFRLSECLALNLPILDEQTQKAVSDLYQFIQDYVFDCTLVVFAKIGEMYVSDDRFTQNIDQFGVGTAQYACDAIIYYAKIHDQ